MWGKILAGVAVGVGAVAAAPFTGGGSLLGGASLIASLTGAGTIAAATGAGLAGGLLGATLAVADEEKKEEIKKKGITEGKILGKAETQVEIDKLENKLKEALTHLKSHDAHFKALIALEAVGVACAACDGDFSENEKAEIGEFVSGMLSQSIPENIKKKIQYIYDNPPTVEEAFILAQESDVEIDLYEDLIKFVMQVDGVKPEEEVFVHAWDQLKKAA